MEDEPYFYVVGEDEWWDEVEGLRRKAFALFALAWKTWTRQQQMILKFSLSLSLMLVQQIRHFLVQLHTHGRLRRLSEGGGVVEDIVVKTVVATSSLHGKQVTHGHNKYLRLQI